MVSVKEFSKNTLISTASLLGSSTPPINKISCPILMEALSLIKRGI